MKLLNVCRSTIRALNRRVSLGSLAIRTCHCDACDTCDARCWRHAQAGEAVFAEIGMLQGLAGRDTLARIEDQHFLKKKTNFCFISNLFQQITLYLYLSLQMIRMMFE